MRTLLALSFLASVTLRAAEDATDISIREKLRAKLRETIPPPPPPAPKPPTETKEELETSPILLKPVVVRESKFIERVTAAMDQAERDRKEQQFSPLNGGTIGTVAGMQVGSWWAPGEGWTFLRRNKAPTHRQVEASKEREKELWDLASRAEKPKLQPAP